MFFSRIKMCRRSMTLIELLISLSIIAMMTVIAIPMFSSYQRRASLNNDVDGIAQLIEYARALHDNPDYQRYSIDGAQNSSYIIKISKDYNNNGIVQLVTYADQETIIDSVKLSSYEEISPENYSFSIYGESPNERLWSCGNIGSGLDNCPKPLDIKVKVKNTDLQKTIRINHTIENFSVEVLNQ